MAMISNGLSVRVNNTKAFNLIRWFFIALIFVLTIIANVISLGELNITLESIVTLMIFVITWLHGTERYGLKNMLVFLVITWIVSNAFEASSIYMGFPFGNYYYTLPGPRILEVPLIIMPSYFGMGYLAWTLSLVLNGHYSKRLQGRQVFLIPFIASFIMVMWDVVMDPMEANVYKSWIWKDGGNYFDIPMSNFFGWFFVVYVFMQAFAVFISRYDNVKNKKTFDKPFWFEAVAVFGVQGLSYILKSLAGSENMDLCSSMGLICFFTMIFVTIISAISISNAIEFKH